MAPTTTTLPSFQRYLSEFSDFNTARERFTCRNGAIESARALEEPIQATATKSQSHTAVNVMAFTERTIFETLLRDHQEEILRLKEQLDRERRELEAEFFDEWQDEIRKLKEGLEVEKREKAELKAKLEAEQGGRCVKRKVSATVDLESSLV
jgi:hypothetical protein